MSNANHQEIISEIRDLLLSAGIVDVNQASFHPLSGGVSCDVVRVDDPDTGKSMVVKRALEKLRVKDDWYADPVRNHYEHRYMSVVGEFLPEAVPGVIHTDDENGFFCMEWLGEGWLNWKTEMLAGKADPAYAAEAGRTLGVIHRETFQSTDIRRQFETTDNFFSLRLESYLLTTGRRHPEYASVFAEESERIRGTRECLVHGDFSPKNILVRDGRLVVLDCEVAWFGDPRFDLAFLLNHLHLKGLYNYPHAENFILLPGEALDAYFEARGLSGDLHSAFEADTARLLLMLMLARVDGKSPVEYFADQPDRQAFIRDFVRSRLAEPPARIGEVSSEWYDAMEHFL